MPEISPGNDPSSHPGEARTDVVPIARLPLTRTRSLLGLELAAMPQPAHARAPQPASNPPQQQLAGTSHSRLTTLRPTLNTWVPASTFTFPGSTLSPVASSFTGYAQLSGVRRTLRNLTLP
jgi:hypothetical protein